MQPLTLLKRIDALLQDVRAENLAAARRLIKEQFGWLPEPAAKDMASLFLETLRNEPTATRSIALNRVSIELRRRGLGR